MTTKEYIKNMSIARLILNRVLGPPKTHREWANRFNQSGEIVDIIKETNTKS